MPEDLINDIYINWAMLIFQCSHTCGTGIRHRKINCYQGKTKVPEKECDRSSRPSNMEVCNQGPCPIWHTSGWERVGILVGRVGKGEGGVEMLYSCFVRPVWLGEGSLRYPSGQGWGNRRGHGQGYTCVTVNSVWTPAPENSEFIGANPGLVPSHYTIVKLFCSVSELFHKCM